MRNYKIKHSKRNRKDGGEYEQIWQKKRRRETMSAN